MIEINANSEHLSILGTVTVQDRTKEHNMNEFKARVEEILGELKTERDDLKVRLHLVKLESSEEWQKLEHQLAKLESKARVLGSATADASEDVGAAAKLLAEEIRDGFKKIARRL